MKRTGKMSFYFFILLSFLLCFFPSFCVPVFVMSLSSCNSVKNNAHDKIQTDPLAQAKNPYAVYSLSQQHIQNIKTELFSLLISTETTIGRCHVSLPLHRSLQPDPPLSEFSSQPSSCSSSECKVADFFHIVNVCFTGQSWMWDPAE